MFNIVERYMQKLTKDDVNAFALKKNIMLSDDELNFTYEFLKKNYKDILQNPNLFDIDRYKGYYTPNNFEKIKKVFTEYYSKYHRFL